MKGNALAVRERRRLAAAICFLSARICWCYGIKWWHGVAVVGQRPKKVVDHFNSFDYLLGGGKMRKKLAGLWICVVWKWRNAVRYNNKEWDFRKIGNEIKCRFWS